MRISIFLYTHSLKLAEAAHKHRKFRNSLLAPSDDLVVDYLFGNFPSIKYALVTVWYPHEDNFLKTTQLEFIKLIIWMSLPRQ